jgi:predicted outer membrane repeat protein
MRHPAIFLGMILAAFLGGSAARAFTFRVPDDFATIQAAVDVASSDDTVVVAPGTYRGVGNREISLHGEGIVLRSVGGSMVTVIDCEGMGRAFTLVNGEPPAASIEGFRVIRGNGGPEGLGGAVLCIASSATFLDCSFESSEAAAGGGAIRCANASPLFRYCSIVDNRAGRGGGILCDQGGSPKFYDCRITGNVAGRGGAVYSAAPAFPILITCSIAGNRAETAGGGIYCEAGSPPGMERDIVWYNCAPVGAQMAIAGGPGPALLCCCVDPLGVDGPTEIMGTQVNLDPRFCGLESCSGAPTTEGDYRLREDSPCVPGNNPCADWIGCSTEVCQIPTPVRASTWGAIRAAFR